MKILNLHVDFIKFKALKKAIKKIKDFPEDSRPRERFLKHGPEVLSDAEL